MNRREIIGGAAAIGAAATALAGTVAIAAQTAPVSQDAAVLTLAARQSEARAALLAYPAAVNDPVEDELASAYVSATNAVKEAPAVTLAGLIAKARVAKVELATNADGSEDPPNFMGDAIGRSIIDDLLRIGGVA